jgi:glycosyltransferase involved in cell wall biosynthesis
MKNILILDTGKEWGGGTNSLLELLQRIEKKNYKFTVLFYHNYEKPGESDIKTEIEKLGIDFLLLNRPNQSLIAKILKEFGRILLFFNKRLRRLYIFGIDYFFRIRKDVESIIRLIKDLNIDLLYMNNQPSTNLEGIIAAKKAGIRSLLHSRIEVNLNFFEVNTVNKWLTKMICVSERIKNSFVAQGINHSKCIVIYNGIDTTIRPTISPDKIKQGLGIKEDELLIGTVGSLIKRKRFNDLIKAVAFFRNKGSGIRGQKIKCIIVGDGPEKKFLEREINRNRLDDTVLMTGFKSDAISYINAMDVFVLPSEREGFPRVILEAMLMGKPVVTSRIAGLSELVIDKKTGFLFQPGNIKELTACISSLLSSPDLRKEMGEASKKRVIENFSIEKYVNQVSRIITEVVE